jgi:hypothetical protein
MNKKIIQLDWVPVIACVKQGWWNKKARLSSGLKIFW